MLIEEKIYYVYIWRVEEGVFRTKRKVSGILLENITKFRNWNCFFSDNLKDKYHILIYFSFPMMMFYYGIYKEIKEKYLKILSQEEKKKIEKDDNLLEVGVYCLFVAILGIIIVSILYDYLKIFL